MKVLEKGYVSLFLMGVFFLPFNSEVPSWLGFLGEYSGESSPIFFLLGFCLLVLHSLIKGSIYIPLKSIEYNIFLFFIFFICLCTFFNIQSIVDYYFKQTSGIQRFIRQLLSVLIIGVVFFSLFINTCRIYGATNFFLLIRKTFLISFSIVFVCGLLEYIIVTFNTLELVPIIETFNYLPFVDIMLDFRLQRLSSITFEPPALSTYLLTISGFMFSYIFTSNKPTRFIPFFLVVILAFFTKSRTAFVVIIAQTLIGVFFAYMKYSKFRSFFNKSLIVGSVLLSIVLIFNGKQIYNDIEERIDSLKFTQNLEFKSSENAVSNKSRLGIQYAMFQVFKEKPLFGTGWGQQTFESKKHYPDWALKHNYEFKTLYLNEDIKSFPPGYNLYLRILAETGVLGLLIFLSFITVIFLKLMNYYQTKKQSNYIVIALVISFMGYFLNWLQIDSFRLYGFWICLSILILLKKVEVEKDNSFNTTL